jgi:hypothetical protein
MRKKYYRLRITFGGAAPISIIFFKKRDSMLESHNVAEIPLAISAITFIHSPLGCPSFHHCRHFRPIALSQEFRDWTEKLAGHIMAELLIALHVLTVIWPTKYLDHIDGSRAASSRLRPVISEHGRHPDAYPRDFFLSAD